MKLLTRNILLAVMFALSSCSHRLHSNFVLIKQKKSGVGMLNSQPAQSIRHLETSSIGENAFVEFDGNDSDSSLPAHSFLVHLSEKAQAQHSSAMAFAESDTPGDPLKNIVLSSGYPHFAISEQEPDAQQDPQEATGATNKLAIISFVTGIFSLIILFILPPIAFFSALAGIILGIKALKQIKETDARGHGLATAGIITSTIAMGLILAFAIIAALFAVSFFFDFLRNL